jgi:coniferyl-aldehyde dehydrogenase
MPSLTGIRPQRAAIADGLSAVLERQRLAFLRDGPPSLKQRRADLAKLEQAAKASANRIADVISADFGSRSRHESLMAEVLTVCASIRHASHLLPYWMRSKHVSVNLELRPGRARILVQPVGVVGIIAPWNYPFLLTITPLISALAAGNRVMLKPSERAPRTAEFIADLLADLYSPEQVATVLGDRDVGTQFSRLPFDHLFYTGSAAIGREVMKAAAENLTPVTLELGGKSPCILGADAVLPRAVDSILYGKLVNAGQSCIAPDYVLLPEAMHEEFVRLAGEAINRMYPTIDNNPNYTSIVDDHHYRRVVGYVEEARASGVHVIELAPANEAPGRNQRKLPPTLVIEPSDELELMQEEIFGPVAADQEVFPNRRSDRLRESASPAARALLLRGERKRAQRGAAADHLWWRFGQRDAAPCTGRGAAVRRYRRFRDGRISWREWVPNLLPPQRCVRAEPVQYVVDATAALHLGDRWPD